MSYLRWKNPRRTGPVSSTSPEEQASSFAGWRRASAPFAILRSALRRTTVFLCGFALVCAALPAVPDLVNARDLSDGPALDELIQEAKAAVAKKSSPDNLYRLALAYSYGAEVATEKKDKAKAAAMAEAGLEPAHKLADGNDKVAEYHRLLGKLCGQVIPANPLMGTLKYGPCARDEINKTIQMDPNFALAYVTRGVGNYYLPSSFGGGPALALGDFDKAIALDSSLAEAYLWKGIALRKLNRNREAHQAIEKSVQLAPHRVWAKEQLTKTPAQ